MPLPRAGTASDSEEEEEVIETITPKVDRKRQRPSTSSRSPPKRLRSSKSNGGAAGDEDNGSISRTRASESPLFLPAYTPPDHSSPASSSSFPVVTGGRRARQRATTVYSGSESSTETGPSRRRRRRRDVLDAVEVPFLPLEVLHGEYAHMPNVKPPDAATRRQIIAQQEHNLRHSAKIRRVLREPAWRVHSETPSEDGAFGGYGDNTDDLAEDESSGSSSEDGMPRRLLRSARQFEPGRATRSQRKNSDDDRVKTRASKQMTNSPRKRRGSSGSRRSSASYHLVESEGEEELDSNEDELYSDTPSGRAPPAANKLRNVLNLHRNTCERCKELPADIMLAKALKKKKKGGRKRKDDDMVSDEERARELEGWLECERCPVSYHWGCLTPPQRQDVLALFRIREPDAPRRRSVMIDEVATFRCSRCTAFPVCNACKLDHITRDPVVKTDVDEDIDARDDVESIGLDALPLVKSSSGLIPSDPAPLLFRCIRCHQATHYEHLKSPFPENERYSLPTLASFYQEGDSVVNRWWCPSCRDWPWLVDRIIAWRPLPADAVEPPVESDAFPNYRDRLPREYLVKWQGRGFRHIAWVPHPWVLTLASQRLKNFIEKGPQLDLVTDGTLAEAGDDLENPTIIDLMGDDDEHATHAGQEKEKLLAKYGLGTPPDVNAEASIPPAWSKVDRVLEVYLFPPKGRKSKKNRNRVMSSEEEDEDEVPPQKDGIQPSQELTIDIERWEKMANRKLTEDDVDEIAPLISWCFVKWDDLQYDQSCYDSPPPRDSELWPIFKRALGRYLSAREVIIPVLSVEAGEERDAEAAEHINPPQEQPECVVGGTLMPFQVEGFQWLVHKHFKRESCILADDMGLGKTIQVCSFLGYIGSSELQIYPSLVIVPNSTITNWVREFEKWVPHIRVVPYFGEAASRKVIAEHELYHPGKKMKAEGIKAHVVLTTYDVITGADFRIFANMPRWEVLIVDEGQRLKSDSSLMFNRLKKLNSIHRVLLTGTPLNNNLRELFNLLNFLDEPNFQSLLDLERRFEDLDESKVQELHNMIKPYILRRIKAEVLKLPPKVEIIVPISMTPVQKALNKRIMHHHKQLVSSIIDARRKKKRRAEALKEAAALEAGKDTQVANGASADAPPVGGSGANGDGMNGKASSSRVLVPESQVANESSMEANGSFSPANIAKPVGNAAPNSAIITVE